MGGDRSIGGSSARFRVSAFSLQLDLEVQWVIISGVISRVTTKK